MKLSISTGFSYTKSYTEILDIIAETGCKNIELFMNQSFINVPLEKIAEAVDVRGLQVTSIHTPIFFIREERGESESYWIVKCIQYAKRLGAKIIVSHSILSGEGSGIKNVDHVYKQNFERYGHGVDYILCTENMPKLPVHSFISDREKFIEFVTKHQYAMTFDITHWSSFGYDLLEGYELMKPYIKNIHLSDFQDGREHLALGKGNQPIHKFLQGLVSDGYQGLITLELDFDNKERNYVQNHEEAVQVLKDCMSYIDESVR